MNSSSANTMNAYTLNDREQTELKLYRILGIKWFQSACFALERWKHRKDGGAHSNYHLRQFSEAGVAGHYAYLSFNLTVHVVSLILLVVHVGVICLIGFRHGFWEVGVAVFALLNIYCILLQRYNSIRFKQFRLQFLRRREGRVQKNAQMLAKGLPEAYSKEERDADLCWLRELKAAVAGGEDFVIAGEDAGRMRRLNSWRECAGVKWHYGRKKIESGKNKSFAGEETSRLAAPLYTGKDKKADWIWRRLSGSNADKNRELLKSYALITADAENERAFQELFGEDSEDRVLEAVDSFIEAEGILPGKGAGILSGEECIPAEKGTD